MKTWVRRAFIGTGLGIACLAAAAGVTVGPMLYRVLHGLHRYETTPPDIPDRLNSVAILIFSKTNGYQHVCIGAAKASLTAIADRHGWSVFTTDNAAVFNSEQLKRFKAVIWNNVSGDVLTSEQRAAFKTYLESGGGFVGIHAAGGDRQYEWAWYVDAVIGAQFIGHTMGPQFQQATVHIEDQTHPATRGLGATWTRTDEWYSFKSNPRAKGFHVLASLDEGTYRPVMDLSILGAIDIHMGDHPVIWTHCVGNGRVFYSALGHQASAYDEPKYQSVLNGAIAWAAGLEGPACAGGKTPL